MMEDIVLVKQVWRRLQSKRHFYSVAPTAVGCFRDKIGIFIECHWPVVCCGCARLGTALLFLLIHWKDCVVRGFHSSIGLGSAALLVIMWSYFLSLTSMACLVYLLLSMVWFFFKFSAYFCFAVSFKITWSCSTIHWLWRIGSLPIICRWKMHKRVKWCDIVLKTYSDERVADSG